MTPVALVAALLAPGRHAPAADAAPPPTFALDHVTVVDVRSGALLNDRMVVVSGERIAAVDSGGTVPLPAGAVRLDASGKFLIPGLWDMHVHLHDPSFLALLVAEGVTGVREMGDDPETIAEWREATRTRRLVGPRIVMAGKILDGPTPVWPRISVAIRNADEAKRAVDDARRRGWDFIKVYSGLSRESYDAILAEARVLRMTVAGHVPNSVTAAYASAAGQKSIEHLDAAIEGCSARPDPVASGVDDAWALEHPDPGHADSLFATFVRNGTWQVPTLSVKRAIANLREESGADDPRLEYIPRRISDNWDPSRDVRFRNRTPSYYELRQRIFVRDRELVGAMRRAGVRFLAGTDLGNPWLFPGFSLHDELGLLVSAGLTPLEALRAATSNPAEFFGMSDSLGEVATGRIADLVLLDANPLADIGNVGKISAVCVRGTLLGRPALDALRSEVKRAAQLR